MRLLKVDRVATSAAALGTRELVRRPLRVVRCMWLCIELAKSGLA